MVLERKFSWKCLKNNSIFFHLSPTLSHFQPLQVENCDSDSRLVVDENDYGKLRLERVKYSQNCNLFVFFFNSTEVKTETLTVFCVMIPLLVDTWSDLGLFRVVRPYMGKINKIHQLTS